MPLKATGSLVSRGVCWLKGRKFVHESIGVPLCYCLAEERHWHRVLPAEVQPYKTYSTPAQEAPCRQYLEGDEGLRTVVKAFKGERPHFTTLHGWLGGMGSYAQGRDTPPDAVPVAAGRSETARRRPGFSWAEAGAVAGQHDSEGRRDELKAASRLLRTAGELFVEAAQPLLEWVRLILSFGHVFAIGWYARSPKTPFQQGVEAKAPVDSSSTLPQRNREEERQRCPTRTRSPPGASSR